jgi:glycerol-3-phosphate dehydrogenase
VDVLVIGGGATGSGVALDAVTRGLSVTLVERDDFACGTSSRSSKLIHGGIRYLEKAVLGLDYEQYRLVEEALRERKHFLAAAPHLTKALPIMMPLYGSFWANLIWGPYFYVGCKVYDLVAGDEGILQSSFYLSKREALDRFPMLDPKNLQGAVVYYDGLQNDSRMNLTIALSAIAHGATVLNHVEALELIKDDKGKVSGARVRDSLTGESWEIHAKVVVNSSGPFTDSIRKMDNPEAQPLVTASAGVHLTMSDRFSPKDMGLIIPKTSDGRVLFLLPWEGSTIAGTTDSASAITELPRPSDEEIEFIIKELGRILADPVSRENVDAAWSGLRPLARDPNAKNTQSIARNHVIEVSINNLITITGGKWTTYRSMAQDVVDEIKKRFPEYSSLHPCKTWKFKLIGAHRWSRALPSVLIRMGFDSDVAEHLSHSYGDKALEVAQIALENDLDSRLAVGYPQIEAEIVYSARNEYSLTAVDSISRRIALAFLNNDAARKALPRVIELLAKEHKWDLSRRIKEYHRALVFLKTFNRRGRKIDVDALPKSEQERAAEQARAIMRVFDFEPLQNSVIESISHAVGESISSNDLPVLIDKVPFFKDQSKELLEEFISHFKQGKSESDDLALDLEEILFAAAAIFGKKSLIKKWD